MVSGTMRQIIMGIVGVELSIFGNKYRLPNLAFVLILYAYTNILALLNLLLSQLSQMNEGMAKNLGSFMSTSEWHKFGVVFVFTAIIGLVITMLLSFFLKAAIVLGSIFLFTRGPLGPIMGEMGISSEVLHFLTGLVVGCLLAANFQKGTQKIAFILLFAIVGPALILSSLNGLTKLDLSLPASIIDLDSASVQTASLPEYVVMGLSIVVSVVIQLSL
ncbi:hypothetical protein NEDG_00794 [Nematocida displodere]|uniref:Uncharacterized protein n=1 Tax=Nematocida displodere TaxID=1805483 RepID=A0A177EDS7_9MICR|nr:hypothetical protein NEDG_00794 [Nematocida displodere]